MAYCPPSKWSKSQDVSGSTDDGWQTVGRTDVKKIANATPAKWGQSALKKPEPKYEDLFPTLSTITVATTAKSDAPKVLTLAERMKLKLAEEEEQKKAEEAARLKAEEDEKKQSIDFLPVQSILRSRQMQIAKNFRVDYTEPEYHEDEDGFRDGYGYTDHRNDYYDEYENDYDAPYEYNAGMSKPRASSYDNHYDY
jgi:hypothetical protein